MTKATYFILTSFVATLALAQPPEEVPPPPPDSGVVESGTPTAAQEVAPAPQPVAEIKALPAPAAPPEDKRLRGVSLSPGLSVYPIGYDNINIGGAEGKRWYFGITPAVSLDTSLKTSSDKTLDFNVGYSFAWREYYNKATTKRDFSNDFSASMGMKLNDQMAWSLPASFGYFFKSGADSNADNSISINASPSFNYTVAKNLSFKVGYDYFFLDLIEAPIGADGLDQNTDAPDDLDDVRRGTYLTDATGFDNFDSSGFGIVPGSTVSNGVARQTVMWSDHTAILGTTFKPIDGTSLGLTYKFLFARISNDDSNDLAAHFITPSITQSFPWKGGSITLANEFRFRKWRFAKVDAGDGSQVAKQAFRSSLRLSVGQDINDYMSFEAAYRMDLVGGNGDNYSKYTNYQNAYMGVSLKF